MQCRKNKEKHVSYLEITTVLVLLIGLGAAIWGGYVSQTNEALSDALSLGSFLGVFGYFLCVIFYKEYKNHKRNQADADARRDLAIFNQKKLLRSTDLNILMRSKCAVAGTFLTIPEKKSLVEFKNNGLDIVEVNLEWADQYAGDDNNQLRPMFERFISTHKDMFVIIKCRPKFEEGKWEGTETNRRTLLTWLAKYVDAVDIELDSYDLSDVVDDIRDAIAVPIVSKHNYSAVDNMTALNLYAEKAFEDNGASIFKYSGYVRRKKDVDRLIKFAKEQKAMGRKCIVSGMGTGKYAKMAREQLPQYTCVAYANVNDSDERLGQLSLEDTVEVSSKNAKV